MAAFWFGLFLGALTGMLGMSALAAGKMSDVLDENAMLHARLMRLAMDARSGDGQ